ncbi:hypothetical protein PE36_11222 [Moritella sp. PE36]|nr:hypothetical protein [Moritella sp. PE36]EDM65526.1 hypothetical protein PE36_11222 [Moritella sp. PE36]
MPLSVDWLWHAFTSLGTPAAGQIRGLCEAIDAMQRLLDSPPENGI